MVDPLADGIDSTERTYLTHGLRTGVTAPVRIPATPTAGMSNPTGIAHDPDR